MSTYLEQYREAIRRGEIIAGQELMKEYCVYKHKFPNGKVYIGITSQNPLKRWSGGSGYRNQKLMYAAILKYGWDNIKHEILFDGLTKEEAEQKEKVLIAKYESSNPVYGYNILDGEDVATHQHKMTEEERKKHSLRLKEKYAHEPHHMTGKKLPYSWKEHIRESNIGKHSKEKHHFYGKHLSESHREKLSKNNNVAVVQQSKDGEIISEFFSISEAHRQTGVDIGHICRCCKGGSKTAGGFIWSYVK